MGLDMHLRYLSIGNQMPHLPEARGDREVALLGIQKPVLQVSEEC